MTMHLVRRSCSLFAAAMVAGLSLLSAPSQAQSPVLTPAQAQAQSDVRREYILGSGDVIRVTVFQNPDLSLETRLTETGSISYPLIGAVQLGGLSVQAAEKALADGLRNGNFVKSPQVSVLVTQVRGHQASALGQLNRPGRYPLEVAGMKLSDLIALAGGVATGGSDIVTLAGSRDGKPFRYEFDLPSLFGPEARVSDPVVQNGDVVFVDRMPVYYIYGEVQRAGVLRLERGMTLMQGLAAGGGLTQRGTEKGLRIHRRGADGKVQVLQPTLDTVLLSGDVIYVRESLF